MKVAMLTDTYDNIGGTEQAIKNFSCVLRGHGHEIELIRNGDGIKKPFENLLSFSPDIVHVHTPGPIGNVGVLYGKAKGVPIVGHFHSLPEVRFYFERDLEKKTVGEFIWKLVKYFYQACNMTISPTEEVRKILKERGFEKVQVLPYGIDTSIFKPYGAVKKTGEILLLYAGWFRNDKRVTILIDALRRLPPKFRLILVGDGPKKKEILQKIKEFNLSGRVSIYNPVQNTRLVEFYNGCDIYVNASVSETLGFSMIEAMACGLPIVAASSPGAKDIIQEDRNGYLAEPNSPESIAEKILLLESEKRRAKLSRISRKLAEEKYDINKVCERLIEIYESIT